MKNFNNVKILLVTGISLVLILNTEGTSIYGQNFTNQATGQNNTQQLEQQLDQANQQVAQANQTQQQVTNQSNQQEPEMNDKLLNLTNKAILALNDDDTATAQDSLVQIQNTLINASGKQVVIIPAPAVLTDESDEGSDE